MFTVTIFEVLLLFRGIEKGGLALAFAQRGTQSKRVKNNILSKGTSKKRFGPA